MSLGRRHNVSRDLIHVADDVLDQQLDPVHAGRREGAAPLRLPGPNQASLLTAKEIGRDLAFVRVDARAHVDVDRERDGTALLVERGAGDRWLTGGAADPHDHAWPRGEVEFAVNGLSRDSVDPRVVEGDGCR